MGGIGDRALDFAKAAWESLDNNDKAWRVGEHEVERRRDSSFGLEEEPEERLVCRLCTQEADSLGDFEDLDCYEVIE